mgnify:CR=1 FL=1
MYWLNQSICDYPASGQVGVLDKPLNQKNQQCSYAGWSDLILWERDYVNSSKKILISRKKEMLYNHSSKNNSNSC